MTVRAHPLPAGNLPRAGWVAFSLLAIAGFGIALYLTIVRFSGAAIYCTMGDGCEMVNSSKYAKLGPFPVALLGTLFYVGRLGGWVAAAGAPQKPTGGVKGERVAAVWSEKEQLG